MVSQSQTFTFPPFYIDPEDGRLWRGNDTVHLTNKAFDVLCYLLRHANQLVTKADLLEAVWPDTYASDATLATCIRELRRALGDRARTPQFIETVRGRGYRFIALPPMTSPPQTPNQKIVGRQAEWTQLQQWYDRARRGERLIGVITGEAGIGKTALVEAFAAHVEAEEPVWIGRGQCIDQYGAGEAYLPLLEVLGRLCRSPHGSHIIRLLKEQAPSWMVQMPALLRPEEREALQLTVSGTAQPRMLRELSEAIEQLSAERSLLLILEDLHWSDTAT